MLFPPTAEEYLATVAEWVDPMPAPVLMEYEGVMVVRDDLLPAGSKARFIDQMIRRADHVQEWVYGASPRVGYGQISLAYVAGKYGKRSTVFVPKANALHVNSERAIAMGAQVIEVPTGFMGVCEARARDYISKTPGAAHVPFGLADETVFGSIIKVARTLSFVPDEVWSVAGSGVLNRGLQLAWPSAACFAVSVGHVLTTEERGRATIVRHPLKFAQACKPVDRPPFPSVVEYDAKAWKYAKESAATGKKVLFWNVAG